MMISSPNFSYAEIQRASDSVSVATLSELAQNIGRTIATLETVRLVLGSKPIKITSLVRSPTRNAEVGGSPSSDHMTGLAADIQVAGLTPWQVFTGLIPSVRSIGIDQLIIYNGHVHIGAGYKGRGQILDARSGTVVPYVAGQAPPIVITADSPATISGQTNRRVPLGTVGAIVVLTIGGLLYSLFGK